MKYELESAPPLLIYIYMYRTWQNPNVCLLFDMLIWRKVSFVLALQWNKVDVTGAVCAMALATKASEALACQDMS